MRSTTHLQHSEEDDPHEPNGLSVALFDDHELIRAMLAENLRSTPGVEVVASGSTAEEAVAVAGALLPQVIIMDVNMPGDGIAAAKAINLNFPAIKVIMLTSDDSEHLVSSALLAGGSAYVIKGSPLRELVTAVKAVARGESYISPPLAARILAPRALGAPWTDDTATLPFDIIDREEQILRRLAQGLTIAEIGEGIGLPETTVAKFLTNILTKLQAYARTEPVESQP